LSVALLLEQKKGGIVRHNYIAATALAITCSAGLAAAQEQTPSPTAAAQSSADQQRAQAAEQPKAIVGCVYREQDVPGRAPNVAEKVGILEDYILAEISSPSAASSATGAVGTSGTTEQKFGAMYKLERINDSKLGSMVGKRVEVTGRVDKDASDSSGRTGTAPQTTTADKAIGHDRVNLAELEVVSIREVAGSCPAKPSDK
jgi:hypothetical protein